MWKVGWWAMSRATGIDAGEGGGSILNRADIIVSAATSAASTAYTYASGSDFSFGANGNAYSYTETDIAARAAGIAAGNGGTTVRNTAGIQVHLENAIARAYTDPNGGSTSGNGNGDVYVTMQAWGQGITLGDGDNVVLNEGTIDLGIRPGARGSPMPTAPPATAPTRASTQRLSARARASPPAMATSASPARATSTSPSRRWPSTGGCEWWHHAGRRHGHREQLRHREGLWHRHR